MNRKTPNRKLSSGFTPLASSTISKNSLHLGLPSTSFNSSRRNTSNSNKKLDGTYNEYLQALAKKRIISTTIRNYEIILKQQINYQNQTITEMRKLCDKKNKILENIHKRDELLTILQRLEEQFKHADMSGRCAGLDQLTGMSDILEMTFRDLKLSGVKHLSNIEEWFSLVRVMNDCCKFLLNFFDSHGGIKKFEMIDEITMSFRETLELQMNIHEQIGLSSSISKVMSMEYLEKMKNLFEILEKAYI